MGLFNYSKPGPGISKDAPKKKGIFLYFEILARKFTKLFTLNFLYFLCSLPMIILYFLIFLFVTQGLFVHLQMDTKSIVFMELLLSLFLSLLFTVILGSGPASAAMAFVMRQYSREEHVWLPSSFFDKIKENFKQEIVVAIVDLIFAFVCPFAVIFYFNQYIVTGSMVWFALLLLIAVFSFLFITMHYYIHQLIVTFDNKLKDVYKNAMLFAMSTVFQNILLTIFVVGLLFTVFNFLNPIFSIILSALILVALLRFPVEFFAHSKIRKTIKYETEEPTDKEDSIFSDVHGSEK